MSFVLDACATLAFIFPDERDAAAIALAADLEREGAIVPALWALELQNAIISGERRGRLSKLRTSELLKDLQMLPVDFDEAPAFGAEAALARRFGLSVYDAVYLEIALRRGLALASRDVNLCAAARELGLEVR